MDVGFLQIRSLLDPIADFQGPRLVVSAVRAGNQFLVLLLEGKPRLKVVFFGCGIVQCPGNDGDNLIRKSEGAVEFLGGFHHLIKGFPGILGLGNDELLDLQSDEQRC